MTPISNDVSVQQPISGSDNSAMMPDDPQEAKLEKRGGSYYLTVDLQKSAAAGVARERVDAELAKAIFKAMDSGGRIGVQEAHEILGKITDGKKYGVGEKALTRMLLSACDDRRAVKLQGKDVNITPPAEQVFQRELPKFWGSL